MNQDTNIIDTIKSTISLLLGTWGLVILCIDTPNTIYCTRSGSPLLVSINDNYAYISSEQSGFCNRSTNYFVLKNNDICILENKDNSIKFNSIMNYNYKLKNIINTNTNLSPYPYKHWTLKEIYDQRESSLNSISLGGRLQHDTVKLGGLESHRQTLIYIDNIILLGCGTSYNAGMIGMYYIKDLCNLNCVQIYDGAEFNENDIPRIGKTAIILLSQSGETKDLHRCITIAKKHNLLTVGVVNVVDSLIAREVNCGCYLNAGRENAVASTKSFTSQVIVLSLIAIWIAQEKNINMIKRKSYIDDLHNLNIDIISTLSLVEKSLDNYIDMFSHSSCFILGKGKMESIAMEGSLKIKEISYIHAEGYSSSSLKHGPFALLDNNFPVILIAPDDENYVKNENIYEEMKARYAKILFITNKVNCNKENVILIPTNNTYHEILSIIPIQLLAYKLAINKDINPDMPKNLAKVVTVE